MIAGGFSLLFMLAFLVGGVLEIFTMKHLKCFFQPPTIGAAVPLASLDLHH